MAVAALPARAADSFGLGSRNAALGGAVSATANDGHAAWYNPAALALFERGGAGVSYVTMMPQVEATLVDPGSLGRIGSYQVASGGALSADLTRKQLDQSFATASDLDRYSGVLLSFSFPLKLFIPSLPLRLVAGGDALIPADGRRLASFSGSTASSPFFPTWNTPFNQARINFALGAELWEGRFLVGAGAAVHSRVEGEVVTLNPVASYDPDNPEGNPPSPSTAQTTQNLGLAASAIAGLLVKPSPAWAFSFVYHGEEETSIALDVQATMELDLGKPIRIEVPYVMSGDFSYHPPRIVAGAAFSPIPRLTLSADAEVGFWSRFADHVQVIEMKVSPDALAEGDTLYLDDLGGSYRVAAESAPGMRVQDTIAPRAGVEYAFPSGLALRGGWSMRPAPLEENQGHANMFLDNTWHSASAGVGIPLSSPEGGVETWLNIHAQGVYLIPRYQFVGRTGSDGTPYARGLAYTEGFMAGFGIELSARLHSP